VEQSRGRRETGGVFLLNLGFYMCLMSLRNPHCSSSGLLFYNRIPKLGSYMAVPLFLKNFLNTESFDSALESTKNYEEQLK